MIVFYLKNIKNGIGQELSKEILTNIVKQNGFSSIYAASILDDFENDIILVDLRSDLHSKKDPNKLYLKWKKNIVYKFAFDFLDSKLDKLRICMLNKKLAKDLLPSFYVEILYSPLNDNKLRLKIWSSILRVVV